MPPPNQAEENRCKGKSKSNLPGPGSHPSRKSKRNLLNFTLASLPELQYFRTDEERQTALDEIGSEAGNPKRGGFWMAIILIVATVVIAQYIAAWLLSYVSWPGAVEEIVHLAAIFGSFVFVIRWLHRWGAAAELRTKLIANGVPVCMKCGYLLYQLPVAVGRCPECGRNFDAEVRRILGANYESDA